MRKLQFYGLPRTLQDRFIESSRGSAVPTPLLVRPFQNKDHLVWAGLAAGFGLLWAGFTVRGFGDLESSVALAGPSYLAVHGAFAAAVVFCTLKAQSIRWEAQRTPYPAGTYLFPAAVIDAKRTELVEHDMATLTEVKTSGRLVVMRFSGGDTFSFDAGGPEHAEQARVAIEAGRTQWQSLESGEALERARLNPLVDSGVPNPLAPTTPHSSQSFLKPFVFGLITLMAASMLGWAVWWWRNDLSEKALFAAATKQNTVAAYQAYLARGGERPEVKGVLLPRAELSEARSAGTVEAIEKYIAAHPTSAIAAEVQAAHRSALLDVLRRAEEQGTVSAVEELPKKYRGATLIAPELAAARRAVFTRALDNFQKQAAPQNAYLMPFVTRLLAYVEKHGPAVDVRMQHQFPQDPESVDQIVSKSKKYFMGQRSLPSRYFLGEPARLRETQLGEALVRRLQAAFPEDVLKFRFAGPAGGINETLPDITVPTLTVSHLQNLSGAYVGGKPKTVFLGSSTAITGTFALPGEGEPLVIKWGRWSPPNLKALDESGKTVPDGVALVYENMLGGAFEEFQKTYLGSWFAAP